MSITIHRGIDQRTDEWHQIRCGLVTASAVGKLLTPTLKVAENDTSRGIITTLAAERITGKVEDTPTTGDMIRGVEHEPFARDAYVMHHTEVEEVGFITRDFNGYTIGYSPDGLTGDGDDGLIEIKCPRRKGHVNTILADEVPAYYMAQCQAALLVSGRGWLDYVSFVGGMPLFVKRVYPDPAWFDAIKAAAEQAEERIADIVDRYSKAVAGLPATERIPDLIDTLTF